MNQLEHDQRPLSAAVLLKLTSEFDLDLNQFAADDTGKTAMDLQQALHEPAYADQKFDPPLLRHFASVAPELVQLFLKAHGMNAAYEERLQALNAEIDSNTSGTDAPAPMSAQPFDEVRDYFHTINNYVDVLDRAAEQQAKSEDLYGPNAYERLLDYLQRKHRLLTTIETGTSSPDWIYKLERTQGRILLNGAIAKTTLVFQLAAIIAHLEREETISHLVETASFTSKAARDVCRIALGNYYAGALLLPYGLFAKRAMALRHDVEQLQHEFGASFEQVCHRLSCLQRPNAKGIPFYFVRVDRAGNITKRHSATKLRFARFGGACPLWNVHEAFSMPGRVFSQVAETPDGTKYLCMARSIIKRAGRYGGFDRHYAVGLGCELKHADAVVYSNGMDLRSPEVITPIGISCRICERTKCPQRAFPPIGQNFTASPQSRRLVPYELK